MKQTYSKMKTYSVKVEKTKESIKDPSEQYPYETNNFIDAVDMYVRACRTHLYINAPFITEDVQQIIVGKDTDDYKIIFTRL